jgi:hypothetical protein
MVAKMLTDISIPLGYKPIERKPVIGRTGPDLSFNELGLVVDVKSRIEVPIHICVPNIVQFGDLVVCPLGTLMQEIGEPIIFHSSFHSKIVDGYYNHMDEWKRENMPDGITALVLRRPKMPFGMSVLVISNTSREKLIKCLKLKL